MYSFTTSDNGLSPVLSPWTISPTRLFTTTYGCPHEGLEGYSCLISLSLGNAVPLFGYKIEDL
jgi:hypothetical protein